MINLHNQFVWFDDRNVLEVQDIKNDILPSISIACAPSCDLICPHCIYNAPHHTEIKGMASEEKASIIRQAAKMGCRFMQICHDGEPLVDPTTMPVLNEAHQHGMRTFMFTHGALITPEIAHKLNELKVCLGVKCDSLNENIFNSMIGTPQAKEIYQGIRNLLEAGYDTPFERDGQRYTRLSLVCTVTNINLQSVKDVARFCWNNNIFFNVARLEKGGRAKDKWEEFRVKDHKKSQEIIDWCSEQTEIDYRYAQPDCYCIGAGGIQVNHNGDVWITREGCGCDLTEPDGITYPDIQIIGNVRTEGLKKIVDRVWEYRSSIAKNLDGRMQEYINNLDSDSNILSACGGSRTHFLFRAYKNYVSHVLGT